jgi:hypothetical protein
MLGRAYVVISGESQWTVGHGLKLGMTVDEVEAPSWAPFQIRQFDLEVGGAVMSWRSGALSKIPESCQIAVSFEPADGSSPARRSSPTRLIAPRFRDRLSPFGGDRHHDDSGRLSTEPPQQARACRREPGADELRDEIRPKAMRPQQQLGASAGGAGEHRKRAALFAGKVFAGEAFAGSAVSARFGNAHRSGRVCRVVVVPQPRHAKARVVGPLV